MTDNAGSNQPSRKCIIHCSTGRINKDLKEVSAQAFARIKEEASQCLEANLPLSDNIFKIIDNLPDEVIAAEHGMHYKCYNTFTANTARKQKRNSVEEDEVSTPKRARLEVQPNKRSGRVDRVMLFPDKCIFCDKVQKQRKKKIERLVTCETKTAEQKKRLNLAS